MLNKVRVFLRNLKIYRLKRMGMRVGENFQLEKGCQFDTPFAWLIDIGNNVTIASKVYILAHDGSTKTLLDYSKVGKVKIGDNVFIGANTTVLPNVTIGNNVIIGCNSVVSKSIPDNSVAVGNPINIICSTEDYIKKHKTNMDKLPMFDESYTIVGHITDIKKREMRTLLENSMGYIR